MRERGGREGTRRRNAEGRAAEMQRVQARDLGRYLAGQTCQGGEPEGPTGLQAWQYDFAGPRAGRRARRQVSLGLRRWGQGEMADRGGQWRVEAVLDVERRPAAGAQGRGQRWVQVRWQGRDEATGEPWGEEWVWCGLLNSCAAAEARAIEQRRDAAARQAREATAAQRAAPQPGAREQRQVAERGTRTRPAEAGLRRSRRQAGAQPELGRACVSETQGRAESVWRARRRVPGQVLEVRGATQLEAVKVKWCYADGSVGGGTMWVSPRQLPRVW